MMKAIKKLNLLNICIWIFIVTPIGLVWMTTVIWFVLWLLIDFHIGRWFGY